MTTTQTPAARVSGTIKALMDALTSALEWIDAVPPDTPLPTMPGFDRDAVDNLLAAIQTDPEPQPVAWRYRDEGEDWRLSADGAWVVYRQSKVSCEVQPLYATPSSAGTVSVGAAALPFTLTTAQLADACMSHRHDYGIVSADQREDRRREAADWWRCLRKTIAEPSSALRALAGEGGR